LRINNNTSAFIDLSRWVAAMLVFIMHLRGVYFVDYSEIESKTFFTNIFYFITGFGSQSVVIFFVISGYLVGGKSYEQLKLKTFSPKSYFTSRISRIYIVLVPALVLGGALDWLGINYFNQSGIYSHTFGDGGLMQPSDSRLNIRVFLVNLASLQTIAGPVLGSNRALWSLANEWWYYILFPLFASIFFHKYKKYSIVISIIIFILLPFKIFLYFLIWLMGLVASIIKFKTNSYFLGIILIILIFLSRTVLLQEFMFFIIALLYSLILTSMNETKSDKKSPYSRSENGKLPRIAYFFYLFNKKLADFSFSLYAIHFPIIFFIFAVFDVSYQCQPHLISYLIFIIIFISTYIISYLFFLAFENKTQKIKVLILKYI
jgi:peptidoglycan/LPS O-acetylase OafA/YrhL